MKPLRAVLATALMCYGCGEQPDAIAPSGATIFVTEDGDMFPVDQVEAAITITLEEYTRARPVSESFLREHLSQLVVRFRNPPIYSPANATLVRGYFSWPPAEIVTEYIDGCIGRTAIAHELVHFFQLIDTGTAEGHPRGLFGRGGSVEERAWRTLAERFCVFGQANGR